MAVSNKTLAVGILAAAAFSLMAAAGDVVVIATQLPFSWSLAVKVTTAMVTIIATTVFAFCGGYFLGKWKNTSQ